MDINTILTILNSNKRRATYGAVGTVLGIPAIGVSARLGAARKEASWVVSANTGKPSGYAEAECHDELYLHQEVIKTAYQLNELILGVEPIIRKATKRSSDITLPKSLEPRSESNNIATLLNNTVNYGTKETMLMGIDLAWLSARNGSGIAVGELAGSTLQIGQLYSNVIGLEAVYDVISSVPNLSGIAVDAPLIIKNQTSNRPCEKELNAVYSSRWAGCHPSNLERYPNSASVNLSLNLESAGYEHLGTPHDSKWQIECYPHPAMIEIFGLERRLAYKKGTVDERRRGQVELARLLQELEQNPMLRLSIAPECRLFFDELRIQQLKGQALKDNEDGLDAALCLYIAGLYAIGAPMKYFGGAENGYIVVPSSN